MMMTMVVMMTMKTMMMVIDAMINTITFVCVRGVCLCMCLCVQWLWQPRKHPRWRDHHQGLPGTHTHTRAHTRARAQRESIGA